MPSEKDKLITALNEIEHLKISQEENRTEIEKVKQRLSAYDILAAKWGGMCMLAVGVGTIVIQFSDKIKSFITVTK